MKKTLIKSIILLSFLSLLLILPDFVSAQPIDPLEPLPGTVSTQNTNSSASAADESPLLGRLKLVAERGGYNTNPAVASSARIIGIVVGAFLGFTGITFIILIIISGYTWMTASGNEEKIKKATSTIKTAIIGLIVSLSAYTLWTFIFQRLIK